MNVGQGILNKGQIINNDYTVKFFLKKGSYAETYRVKDKTGKAQFLKLFVLAKLHRTQFDENGNVLEIEILKRTNHPNVVKYYDSEEFVLNGNKYAYVILDYISGETLADKLKREKTLNKYEAKDIIRGVLNGLDSLYSSDRPIIHNDITNLNVMLDLSGEIPIPKIIDFGYARFLSQSNKEFLKEGLNPFYQANETFNGIFSVQSDIFSIGALYYHILEELPPWFIEISKYKSDVIKMEDAILDERKKSLKFYTIKDESTQNIIRKAIHPQAENRFQNIDEFMRAINGELNVEIASKTTEKKPIARKKEKGKGKGFAAIAGMQELKDQLKNDVIDVIENPEEYKQHNIGIPNGILLYGPPGCGKTFFAERFAEEANYHFIKVASSDIASIYIHGSQEKIGELFDTARKNAPAILYFDELDAMIPKRDNLNNASQSGEVNEFLTQLDNVGESGVFVIGSTNKPDSIDIAALRAGRIEQQYYVSPPDFEARKGIFKLYLKNRLTDVGLKYAKLAEMTEDYVSSDIKLIIDKTSRRAINELKKANREESRITMSDLKFVIENHRPTVKRPVLLEYEKLRKRIEDGEDDEGYDERPKIGF